MNILVISSSLRKGGNSDLLCDQFIKGAKEAGHEVNKIELRKLTINPCLGCDCCQDSGKCVQEDGMDLILNKMNYADMVVFATPVYFYNISASLKLVLDRTYAFYQKVNFTKTMLIETSADEDLSAMNTVIQSYKSYLKCLNNVEDIGHILATGVYEKGDIISHKIYKQAYDIGKNLK